MVVETLKGVKGKVYIDLIALALKSKKVSMEKAIKMVDDIVALLGEEQEVDNAKNEQCEKDVDETEDKHKESTSRSQTSRRRPRRPRSPSPLSVRRSLP